MFYSIKSIFLVSLVLVFASSCKKYDDDEKRSWQTAKSRISKKWRIDFPTTPSIEYEFKKDGTLVTDGNTSSNTWIFDSKRDHFIIIYENDVIQDFKINQLEKTKMVATYTISGFETTWVFNAIE